MEIRFEKVRDTGRLSLWRMVVDRGNERELYLIELPKRYRSVEVLKEALEGLGFDVAIMAIEKQGGGKDDE